MGLPIIVFTSASESSFSRDELRKYMADKSLVYIYHNVVDNAGEHNENKVFDVVILHKIRFRLLTWVKFGIIITQEKPFVNRKFSQMSMLLAKY